MKKVKKRKLCLIIVASILIGIIASVGISYALAETLINSKDVVYQDNSNLAADNVQSAIDGTCSKIDTRLSDIEDKLYTVSSSSDGVYFTTSTTYSDTGISITLPANSYCSLTVSAFDATSIPRKLGLVGVGNTASTVQSTNTHQTGGTVSVSYNAYIKQQTTFRIFAMYDKSVTGNFIKYDYFCATKYK